MHTRIGDPASCGLIHAGTASCNQDLHVPARTEPIKDSNRSAYGCLLVCRADPYLRPCEACQACPSCHRRAPGCIPPVRHQSHEHICNDYRDHISAEGNNCNNSSNDYGASWHLAVEGPLVNRKNCKNKLAYHFRNKLASQCGCSQT